MIRSSDVERLIELLANRTPPSSVDPSLGEIEACETLWGDPPNMDGDGITDLLWVDIRDQNGECTGFVDPADFDPGRGNGKDIVATVR